MNSKSTHMRGHISMSKHVHICMRTYTCTHMCTHAHTCTHIHMYTYACAHICTHVRVHTCIARVPFPNALWHLGFWRCCACVRCVLFGNIVFGLVLHVKTTPQCWRTATLQRHVTVTTEPTYIRTYGRTHTHRKWKRFMAMRTTRSSCSTSFRASFRL